MDEGAQRIESFFERARAGVLASRSSWEFAAAQVCREGGRVSMNVFVRDLDLPVARMRLEVVVDGLPLFGRGQLASGSSKR